MECLQACDADGMCKMMSYDSQHNTNNCYVILTNEICGGTTGWPQMYADYNQNSGYAHC
jgi:hypothetical protein